MPEQKRVSGRALSNETDNVIDLKIRQTIDGCDAVLFVVGDSSHNRPWVNREAELAKSIGAKIVITQMSNTAGGIPNALKDSNYLIADWNETSIANNLN